MTRIIRWTPVQQPTRSPLGELLDEFVNDLWNTLPTHDAGPSEGSQMVAKPLMDIAEHENGFEFQIELPGVAPEDVTIEFEKGLLTISTATVAETPDDEAELRYTRRERHVGAFERRLRVPDSIDADNASAHFEHGVLYLTLPKKPQAQPIRIPVQANGGHSNN